MTLTQIDSQAAVTSATTGTGVDVSAITGDWTLKINVQSIGTSDGTVPVLRFAFEDSVNSFTASLAGPTASFKGSLGPSSDKVKSWKKQDFPDLRAGVGSALLRLHLTDISANTSTSYRAWIEF